MLKIAERVNVFKKSQTVKTKFSFVDRGASQGKSSDDRAQTKTLISLLKKRHRFFYNSPIRFQENIGQQCESNARAVDKVAHTTGPRGKPMRLCSEPTGVAKRLRRFVITL